MRARKRNSNDDWQEIAYVQLKDSYVITPADLMEFEAPTTEVMRQGLREQAAIAAMQGMLSNSALIDDARLDYRITIEKAAIGYADELIKLLQQ